MLEPYDMMGDMMGDMAMMDGMMDDKPMAAAEPGGMLCNTLNTMQKNRENCWWNYQNDLPLITKLPMVSEGMMGDKMKSDGM